MDTRLTMPLRVDQIVQHVEHSKPKTMNSFIRVQKNSLEEFTTLLENLCVSCMRLVRLQLKSNHNVLIGWIMQQMAEVATLTELKAWHVKHQSTCALLTHACVASLQPMFAFLYNISSNFDHHKCLKEGNNLPYDKHAILTRLMN